MKDRFMALEASYQNEVIPKFETCFNLGVGVTAWMKKHLLVTLVVTT